MVGLSMASSLYAMNEQKNQADFQADVAAQNAKTANEHNLRNYHSTNRLLNIQEAQENEAVALSERDQKLQAAAAISAQRTASGEAGVSGLSIDSLFSDVMRQTGNNLTMTQRNASDSRFQREADREANRNGTWSNTQTNAVYKPKNALLGAGLQLASSGANAFVAQGGSFQAPRANGKWQNPFVMPKGAS